MDDETKKEIRAIWEILGGNGGVGVLETVRVLERDSEMQDTRLNELDTSMRDIKEAIRNMINNRKEEHAEWRGAKRVLWIMFGVLTFLVGGGYAATIATLRIALGTP